jgi:hypothetical protein
MTTELPVVVAAALQPLFPNSSNIIIIFPIINYIKFILQYILALYVKLNEIQYMDHNFRISSKKPTCKTINDKTIFI